jgi:hypothetical protein
MGGSLISIDCKSLRVEEAPPQKQQVLHLSRNMYSSNGKTLTATRNTLHLGWDRTDARSKNDRGEIVLKHENSCQGVPQELLLPFQNKIYLPGCKWYRVNPADWHVETLTQALVPYDFWLPCYGVSTHYGLVAWGFPTWNSPERKFRFCRVSVKE